MDRAKEIRDGRFSRAGFTLIELMVVLAIIGILAATAVPMHSTYRQRAYGSEAILMMKKLLEAELIYYLEHNRFFPPDGQTVSVHGDVPNPPDALDQISDALKITIPAGHKLDYDIQAYLVTPKEEYCTIVITAPFVLFSDKSRILIGTAKSTGELGYTSTGGE